MFMKKLLMLGTSFVSTEIVQTAKEMGCYTIVTDNLPPERSRAKRIANEYWMISTSEIDLLEKKCMEEGIDAVFAGVSEFNLDMVKELTGRLSLPCYIEDEPWRFARDKQAFKQRCREIGIPVAEEYTLSDPPCTEETAEIEYPVVVKPVDGAGNKGLSICHDESELAEACSRARAASGSGRILVERYLPGEESWNTYMIAEDEIRCVSRVRSFRQPGYPTFLYPVNISAMEDSRAFKEQIDGKCIELLRSVRCRKGIAWIQLIRDKNGKYYAVEMAYRMHAGETSALDEKGQGYNPVKWELETALGIEQTASMIPLLREPPYKTAYVICFIFAGWSGKVFSMQGFDELDQKRFMVSNVVQEGSSVRKYSIVSRVVFNVKSSEELCDTLRYLNERIAVLDENGANMLIQYTNFDFLRERTRGLFLSESREQVC